MSGASNQSFPSHASPIKTSHKRGLLFVLFLCNPSLTLIAQLSANHVFTPLFGTNPCTAKCDVRVLNDSFKESFTETFALLDGKTRTEIDMGQMKHQMIPPAATRQMGIDQKVIILRPDLKLTYVVFPRLRAYVKSPFLRPGEDARNEPTLEKTPLGTESVDGHPCTKNKVIITTGDGEKHELSVWSATDLKDFPIRIEAKDGENIELSAYKEIQFVKSDPKQFEVPAGFKEYADFSEMMEKAQGNVPPDATSTNALTAGNDRLASVVEFTLRSGTNQSVGPLTAKAFGLGDERIPTMQIVLGQKEEPVVHLFAISARNSNDLFVGRINRNTRDSTIWLTSGAGEIRATVVTSTNGQPKAVPNASRTDDYQSELNFLLEATAPPPWEDVPHPLNVVARFGDVADVEKILKRDPKAINLQDDEGMTPVACAVVQAQADTVRLLLDNGADPNIPNKNGLTPLEHACGRDKAVATSLVKLLLAKGAEVNRTNKGGFSLGPLSWAVSSDNTELVKLLLDRGADAKAKTENGDTALHSAASRGDVEIAAMLIEHGADVNAKITGGTTPLHQAAWNGHEELIKLLLSKGAEVDPKRSDGITPLYQAGGPGAERHGKGCLEVLLAHGANINVADAEGNTLLHTAAYYGNKEVIEVLLAHGKAVDTKNKRGETALQIASRNKHPAIVELLRQHGAKE
jgi:ankyrin repeat protein